MRLRARVDTNHAAGRRDGRSTASRELRLEKTCQQCGVVYHSRNKRARFCSSECFGNSPAQLARLRTIPHPRTGRDICACGRRKSYQGVTCIACYKARQPPKAVVICRTCQQPFSVKRSHGPKKTYCSRACMANDYRASYSPTADPLMPPRPAARFRIRKDSNHDAVVQAFERCGCPTIDLHQMGRGAPDILVLCRIIRMVEIKNRSNSYGKRGLSPSQQIFNEQWGNVISICNSPEEAVSLVNGWRAEVQP